MATAPVPVQASTSSGTSAALGTIPDSGPVTPKEIYQLLLYYGFSTIQAIGIMANMVNESSLDPEEVQKGVSDPGYGLVQWEASSYSKAPSLVTGNAQADVRAQIKYLAATVSPQQIAGSSATEVAGNFAQYYERCAECGYGQSQYNSRVANVATIAGWLSSGKWPTSGTSSFAGGTTASSTATVTAACLWQIDLGAVTAGSHCVISKTEARAFIGGGLMIAGALTGIVALAVMFGAAFTRMKSTAAGQAASSVTNAVTGLIPGAGAAKAVQAASEPQRDRGQERHDEKVAREVEGRKRDSAKGPALREDDEEVPF